MCVTMIKITKTNTHTLLRKKFPPIMLFLAKFYIKLHLHNESFNHDLYTTNNLRCIFLLHSFRSFFILSINHLSKHMHLPWQLHQSWPLSRPTFISTIMYTNLVNHKRVDQRKPQKPRTPLSCIDMQRL